MYTKETLEELLDIMPEYIFYRDKYGNNIYCNESYANELMGLRKDEILGLKYEDLMSSEAVISIGKKKDLEIINKKIPVTYQQSIINGYKMPQDIEISKYPSLNEDGEVKGILGIIRDMSYKKELEKLREGFFSNVRHEFRTPLNLILSNIQLLEYKCSKCVKDYTVNCKECFTESIEQIYNNSLRLLKLSNNFIDLTNIQVGEYWFNPRNHDVVNFVENICDNINSYKKFKNIELIFDTDIEELVISFDYLKIERVILNIISNAIKFNKENGKIIVSITTKNNRVKISIKDTGIGIEKDRLDNIFDTFSNVEDRFTKVCEGSGVGLALSKYLIEMHRGSIMVNSEIGIGTEFIISLPNIYEEDEEIDRSYLKVESDIISRIKTELSDIYIYE